MEQITFSYIFSDENDQKEVKTVKQNADGLHDYDVCDMFMDFMRSVGFSEENIYRYFQE